MGTNPDPQQTNRSVKIYADGVFDLVHSGHFNAMRQAKALGDWLVVGINSDDEVLERKGIRTIYNQNERAEIVSECKWVDEIITGTPYAVTSAFLDQTGCDFVAHGDDMPLCFDGSDCYASPRRQNKVKLFRRTEGISTSAMVQRLLRVTAPMIGDPVSVPNPQPLATWMENSLTNVNNNNISGSSSGSVHPSGGSGGITQDALLTTRRLGSFIGAPSPPRPGDRIVYVDGSFDVFHVGHVRLLKKAKALGDFLVVGLHDDNTVERMKGPRFPVMNLLERAMNVLAMKMVDEVIMGAPQIINEYLINSFHISAVARSTALDIPLTTTTAPPRVDEEKERCDTIDTTCSAPQDEDPYKLPKALGIYNEIEDLGVTTKQILRRIADNRDFLNSTIRERVQKESDHYSAKRDLTEEG